MKKSFRAIAAAAIIPAILIAQDVKSPQFPNTDASGQYVPYGVERQMPSFLDSMKTRLTYPMAWGNSDITDFGKWREKARGVLIDAMMTIPPAPKDYAAEIICEEQRDGYKARIVQLNLSDWTRVNVYLLVPDAPGPHPGILMFHDHGGHFLIGKEKMIKPIARGKISDTSIGNIIPNVSDTLIINDANRWAHQCYGDQYMGDYMAKNGYVVVCGDALFWGERGRKEGVRKDKLNEFAGNLMGMGYCMSGITTAEDSYLAAWLATLPEVDATRIGCAGFSMGAYRAWMASALTDAIGPTAAICWMTTTDNQFSWEYGRENGGYANTLPTIRHSLDHPHVASIACPKPMLFINGETDKLFKRPGVESAYATMHAVWNSQNAGDKLTTTILPMSHWCGPEVQEIVLNFFNKYLKDSDEN